MVEKRPPMTPEEKQRLLDMADRILNSELGQGDCTMLHMMRGLALAQKQPNLS